MNTYYYLFYSFIIYAFFGWLLEVMYHIYIQKRFINRGFLFGPICPIYGISAVLFIVLLTPIRDNLLLLFIGGTVVASIVEYITGYLLEKSFNTKWWDYSDERFNMKGYICLKFSVIWGMLSVIFIRFVNPGVSRLTYLVIAQFGEVLYNIILILLIIDSTHTINSLISFRKLFIELEEAIMETRENMDKLMEKAISHETRIHIQQRIIHLEEIRERIAGKLSFRHRYMLHAYPRITSKRFGSAIEEIRERFDKFGLKR